MAVNSLLSNLSHNNKTNFLTLVQFFAINFNELIELLNTKE